METNQPSFPIDDMASQAFCYIKEKGDWNAALLVFEEGSGLQPSNTRKAAPDSGKGKDRNSFLEPPERPSPESHFEFIPVKAS